MHQANTQAFVTSKTALCICHLATKARCGGCIVHELHVQTEEYAVDMKSAAGSLLCSSLHATHMKSGYDTRAEQNILTPVSRQPEGHDCYPHDRYSKEAGINMHT